MKLFKKLILSAIVVAGLATLSSCSNLKLRTHAGVSIDWGSDGPKVRPHIDVDVYNGGKHH